MEETPRQAAPFSPGRAPLGMHCWEEQTISESFCTLLMAHKSA